MSRPRRPQYYVQFTSIPESEAPPEHCQALVGKVFPLMPRNMDGPEPMEAVELESNLPYHVVDGVAVELRHLVAVLRAAGDTEAANYWEATGFASIIFRRSEVRVFLPHHSGDAGELIPPRRSRRRRRSQGQ
jgi:hypothetical protein